MRFFTITSYFIFAIIILASIGVSLPLVFDSLNNDPNLTRNLNQNLVTYFIAIMVSASLDYIMKLIDQEVSYRKLVILIVCIGNTLIFLISAYILYQNGKSKIPSFSSLSIFGILASYIMWWVANYNNSAFNINSVLGGNTEKPLANGK